MSQIEGKPEVTTKRKVGEIINSSMVLIFPGQGLAPNDIFEYHSFLESVDDGRPEKFLKTASEIAELDIAGILKTKDRQVLESTAVMQPVVYALSMAAYNLVHARWDVINANFVAGHSLGEYSALTAAGVISFEDGMRIVRKRGAFMDEDAKRVQSRHIAVIGWEEEKVGEFCMDNGVKIALINAPTNSVIGCLADNAEGLMRMIREKGGRAVLLSTAGAFHDEDFFRLSAERLQKEFEGVDFKDATRNTVISNLTGLPERSGEQLKMNAVAVMTAPVRWADGIRFMDQQHPTFYEIGPGRSLEGINRQNNISPERTKNIVALLR